jgi:pimeloyl-ACP methyl ester carboxylesterase
MKTVISKDGTVIAFDRLGRGPALILVGGALEHRAMDSETAQLAPLLAEHFTVFHYDRRGEAVTLFMQYVGMPDEQIEGMRHSPAWPSLEAIAPTLAYDHAAILGEDASVPIKRAAQVRVPTLVMNGGASYPFMYETARTLSWVILHAQLRTLEGQDHGPADEVLAPVLETFFLG